MDASSESGFKWILARLHNDLRQKHCSQALQEEIDDVLARLAACSEAMAHAAQVEDAVASLQANQSGDNAAHVRIRTPSVTALLDELPALQRACGDKLALLLKPFLFSFCLGNQLYLIDPSQQEMPKDAVTKQLRAEKVPQSRSKTPEESNIYAEVGKTFLKVQKIVTKQRGSDWIAHAVELVRETVKSYPDDSAIENVGSGDAHKRAKKELKRSMLSGLKPLREALLDNAAENRDEMSRFRKSLKKLAKCNPGLHKFYEESEAVLSEKEQHLVAKEQRKAEKAAKEREAEKAAQQQRKAEKAAKELREAEKAAQEQRRAERAAEEQVRAEKEKQRADNVPQKKRKLPDYEAAPTESAESSEPLPLGMVRELMIQCLREVSALGSHFTMESYDVNLSRITRATQSLSEAFTYDDASAVAINLFRMIDYVEKITQPMRRKNRILRLETALKAMLAARYLPWSKRQKGSTSACLEKCKVWLKELKKYSPSNDEEAYEEAPSHTTATPAPHKAAKAKQAANASASSKKKATAQKTTVKQDQPAKTKRKNEEAAPASTHVRFKEQESRELVASKSHVRFDD